MPEWLHQGIMWVHIAAGIASILLGTIAVAARKGGWVHARAGTGFFGSMLALGGTASILEPFRTPTPGSPLVGVVVAYFVLTSWMTARRGDGTTGWFEVAACLVALGLAAATVWGAVTGSSSTPVGAGPVFAFAGLLLVGGLGDLKAILRRKLRPAQRISRHLWRMCFAFFIATGSFFIGQQDVMPQALRGSPTLLILGFAPIAVMAFWLIRLRFSKPLGRLQLRIATARAA